MLIPLASGAHRDSKPKEFAHAGSNKNIIDIDEPRTGPYFDKASSKNITALLGKTAYLSCRVKNLGNKTVSFGHLNLLFGR